MYRLDRFKMHAEVKQKSSKVRDDLKFVSARMLCIAYRAYGKSQSHITARAELQHIVRCDPHEDDAFENGSAVRIAACYCFSKARGEEYWRDDKVACSMITICLRLKGYRTYMDRV